MSRPFVLSREVREWLPQFLRSEALLSGSVTLGGFAHGVGVTARCLVHYRTPDCPKLPRGSRRHKKVQRNRAIREMRGTRHYDKGSGETFEEIAAAFDISKQRVQQICSGDYRT